MMDTTPSPGDHEDVVDPASGTAGMGDVGPSTTDVDAPTGSATKAVSEKQLRANRQNAQRSTGPATSEGRQRSSQNRVIHGIFMDQPLAICRGRFQEDVNEVGAYVDNIIEALGPRDQLEYCEARRVASCYLRHERLDNYEVAAVGYDATLSTTTVKALGHPDRAAYLVEVINVIEEVTEDSHCDARPQPFSPISELFRWVNWADMARYIEAHAFDVPVTVPGVWDENHTPDTDHAWYEAYRALLFHRFPDLTDAKRWIAEEGTRRRLQQLPLLGVAEAAAAKSVLHGSFEQALKLRGRLDRSLANALARYDKLRSRTDVDPDLPLQHDRGATDE